MVGEKEINKAKSYGEISCLGSIINSNIYTFTKKYTEKPIEKIKPKFKYLVKFIKNLCKIFKNYSYEFFVYHIYSKKGIDKSLNSGDMQIIRKYFSKENNLKELDISSKRCAKRKSNNISVTGSHYEIESLERKKWVFKTKRDSLICFQDPIY